MNPSFGLKYTHNFFRKPQRFINIAREDSRSGKTTGLKLKHWTRVLAHHDKEISSSSKDNEDEEMHSASEDTLDEGVYPFSKYTLPGQIVYSYTDEEYSKFVEDSAESGWTKSETDYLFKLLQEYSLRFYIVLDRYEYRATDGNSTVKRELEDLKARYYSVVRKLVIGRAGEDPEKLKASEAVLLHHGYDYAREKKRRQHIKALWERTPQQVAEETMLYTELLRLAQTETEFTARRHGLLRLLAGIESGLPDIPTRDDRLTALNLDPQIRGVKGGLWGSVLSGMNSAGPSATRKKRVGGVGQSMDWGESPTHGGGNMVISLGGGGGGAGSQRQLLPPAQQAEYDAKHHIHRAPPGSGLINSKNTHTPVHARSSKFPVPKPILASHLQAFSNLIPPTPSGDGATGTGGTETPSGQNIFARVGINSTKLAMPTKENIEWMERVFSAATQWVEVQKQLERVEAEVAAQKVRLGISTTSDSNASTAASASGGGGGGATAGGVKEEKMEGVESTGGTDTAEQKARRSTSRTVR
ncbi:hypothetical protein CPB86DRAFT_702140 [Serendipita vermifera]|nr:hypothetical protein CPB86DRAFT_702140 [Serendipita vermifera]